MGVAGRVFESTMSTSINGRFEPGKEFDEEVVVDCIDCGGMAGANSEIWGKRDVEAEDEEALDSDRKR